LPHEKLHDEKGLYYAMWRQQIDKRKMKAITIYRCWFFSPTYFSTKTIL